MENIVAKGEIARFVQFFFYHYVFKKPFAVEASESVYMRERVNRSCSQLLTGKLILKLLFLSIWDNFRIILNVHEKSWF